jgi:hypothetical protein
MILVRDVFRLKFGHARPALALMKELQSTLPAEARKIPMRVLTDLVGPYYTLVMEMTHENLASLETMLGSSLGQEQWREWYTKFQEHCESGYREVFTIAM